MIPRYLSFVATDLKLLIHLKLRHVGSRAHAAWFLIAHEIAPVIENVTTFYVFYKALLPRGLWKEIFVEFRDNGLLSCRTVVSVG